MLSSPKVFAVGASFMLGWCSCVWSSSLMLWIDRRILCYTLFFCSGCMSVSELGMMVSKPLNWCSDRRKILCYALFCSGCILYIDGTILDSWLIGEDGDLLDNKVVGDDGVLVSKALNWCCDRQRILCYALLSGSFIVNQSGRKVFLCPKL